MSAHGAALGYRAAAGPSGWCGGAQRGGREREHNEERATMAWCDETNKMFGTPSGHLLWGDNRRTPYSANPHGGGGPDCVRRASTGRSLACRNPAASEIASEQGVRVASGNELKPVSWSGLYRTKCPNALWL